MENQEKAEMATQRSDAYGLLAAVYRQEVASNLLNQIKDPEFLGVLSGLGFELADSFINAPESELLEALAVEYAMLFLGPGEHISPHESVHHQRDDTQSGMLWGETTVEVKKFIEFSGLELSDEYTGLPDHISIELELMQQIAKREAKAWKEEDRNDAMRCRKYEKQFVEEHLARWVPGFCEKVVAGAELPFYREMALLTKAFLAFESHGMDQTGTAMQ
jgi:TorA maturation chaperone TorD